MTDVVRDFNVLYENIKNKYNLTFVYDCCALRQNGEGKIENDNSGGDNDNNNDNSIIAKSTRYSLSRIQEHKSYLCCAINEQLNCVLHKCVLVVFGTELDRCFRQWNDEEIDAELNANMRGTFMLDGRFLSFPNIMMNNNILAHNFYDKLYAKHCKRMFLYGNMDKEKHINRAIQLVYDRQEDMLFARDVYACDYVVTQDLNATLETYLSNSGKWEPLNFIFQFTDTHRRHLLQHIKLIMSHDICYSIDNLANKIIYKHDYLIELLLTLTILQNYQRDNTDALLKAQQQQSSPSPPPFKKRKTQTILYNKESKKIVDTIVNGRLIYSVSKTFSKQRKSYPNQQDNCTSNNNIEITLPVLKYRIGNEVTRITNETMRQKMLKQKKDFVKFVDSFFHGEMTVAGKKFFLCRNVRLPSVNYQMVADKFRFLLDNKLIEHIVDNIDNYNNNNNTLLIAFNDRPTNLKCFKTNLRTIVYTLKRNMAPIELKANEKILFINHHEGMVCIKKTLFIKNTNTSITTTAMDETVHINALLTPYEYHYKESLFRNNNLCEWQIADENDDVTSLMSKLEQYYYKGFVHLFHTVPVPKLIVSLTNLKNAMPVLAYDQSRRLLPAGYSVTVHRSILVNNKMFKLWTLVRDNKLMTAEDPYIPHMALPIRMYNNKINKLKGKIITHTKSDVPFVKFVKSVSTQNCAQTDTGNILYAVGTVVCGNRAKINWVYDGRRYKIETCNTTSGAHNIYKIYVYFRQMRNQIVETLDATMVVSGDNLVVKITVATSTDDLEGVKICGIHGQKGVFNRSEDLTEWMAEDGTHAQICLSPVSFLSRQSNFDNIERKYVVRGGNFADRNAPRYPIFNIPYMLFNNTPDNIFKEFIKNNYTGHEKVEGTRFDQWTKNQSFVGNRLAESLHWMRGGSNLPNNCGEFNVLSSLLMCNNITMK